MKKPSGFTLAEVAVAIAVVAILAGILVPLVLRAIRDARIARAKADLKVIAGAIAQQLKDTACRPRFRTARGDALTSGGIWYSAGNDVWICWPQNNLWPLALRRHYPRDFYPLAPFNVNTFVNLFTPGPDDPLAFQTAKDLFVQWALQSPTANGYRGPYLTRQMAEKADPWGHRYMIFGYNRGCGSTGGPIYVVCAGESGGITADNLLGVSAWDVPPPHGANRAHAWTYAGPSATNLVVQVN
jgi:prepilin-type N-terminal cleavage/methylation domain-containing protein